MIIDKVLIRREPGYPTRIHMAVSDGVVLSGLPLSKVMIDNWTVHYWSEHAITFYSDVYKSEVDEGWLGSRAGTDIAGAYFGDQAAVTPFVEWWGECNPHPETVDTDIMVPWEGVFNAHNVLGQPYYPVTVFSPDQQEISRDLFMPVLYINELLELVGSDYRLVLSEIAAYNDEIVFELQKVGIGGPIK